MFCHRLYLRFNYNFWLFSVDFEMWTNDMKEIIEQTQTVDKEYVEHTMRPPALPRPECEYPECPCSIGTSTPTASSATRRT
jgi:hypothetical protein